MDEPTISGPFVSPAHEALMFPTLTPAQIARIASHGVVRPIAAGEILIEAGDPVVPFFVVTRGTIEIVRPSGLGDTLVAVHGPGRFTGEANLHRRPALVDAGACDRIRGGDRADP